MGITPKIIKRTFFSEDIAESGILRREEKDVN